MEKYRDVDEDELLKKLSEEELRMLEDELEELDPDVSHRGYPHVTPVHSPVHLFIHFFYLERNPIQINSGGPEQEMVIL